MIYIWYTLHGLWFSNMRLFFRYCHRCIWSACVPGPTSHQRAFLQPLAVEGWAAAGHCEDKAVGKAHHFGWWHESWLTRCVLVISESIINRKRSRQNSSVNHRQHYCARYGITSTLSMCLKVLSFSALAMEPCSSNCLWKKQRFTQYSLFCI